MISPGFEPELAREREREIEREIERAARRPKGQLLADAAPAISVVVGTLAVLILGFPLIP